MNEVSQTKTNTILYHSKVLPNFKKWHKCTYLKYRNRLSHSENRLMITKGETWGMDTLEIGMNIHKPAIYKIDSWKGPPI